MSKQVDPKLLAALVGLGSLGAFHFPSRVCDGCGKPIASGEAYRDIRGIGTYHPECDPREKAKATQSS